MNLTEADRDSVARASIGNAQMVMQARHCSKPKKGHTQFTREWWAIVARRQEQIIIDRAAALIAATGGAA